MQQTQAASWPRLYTADVSSLSTVPEHRPYGVTTAVTDCKNQDSYEQLKFAIMDTLMEHFLAVLSVFLGSLGIWLIHEDPEEWVGWGMLGIACYTLERSLRDIRVRRAFAQLLSEEDNVI